MYIVVDDENKDEAIKVLNDNDIDFKSYYNLFDIFGENEAEFRVNQYEEENGIKLNEEIREKILSDLIIEYSNSENILDADYIYDYAQNNISKYIGNLMGDNE